MRATAKSTTRKATAITLAAALVVAVYLNWQYSRTGVSLNEDAVNVSACLCFLQSGRADLTVMTSGDALTAAQVAQIRDIVLSKSSVTAQNITVVEVK